MTVTFAEYPADEWQLQVNGTFRAKLLAAIAANAAQSLTPAEIAASVTGKSLVAVQVERATG